MLNKADAKSDTLRALGLHLVSQLDQQCAYVHMYVPTCVPMCTKFHSESIFSSSTPVLCFFINNGSVALLSHKTLK